MSNTVMDRVWAAEHKSRAELLVLLAIADYTNDRFGYAWPSIDSLAKKARCTQRGVQKIIARLVKAKKLSVEYGKGEHGTNRYRVLIGGVNPVHPEPRGAGGFTLPPNGAIPASSPNLLGTLIEPLGTPHKPPKPEGGSSGSEVGKSLHLERVKKAKTEMADRLRHQYASEVAGGEMLWSDPDARSQHAKLRVEIRKLTNQIAGMG